MEPETESGRESYTRAHASRPLEMMANLCVADVQPLDHDPDMGVGRGKREMGDGTRRHAEAVDVKAASPWHGKTCPGGLSMKVLGGLLATADGNICNP
jgi:hypothetical protein